MDVALQRAALGATSRQKPSGDGATVDARAAHNTFTMGSPLRVRGGISSAAPAGRLALRRGRDHCRTTSSRRRRAGGITGSRSATGRAAHDRDHRLAARPPRLGRVPCSARRACRRNRARSASCHAFARESTTSTRSTGEPVSRTLPCRRRRRRRTSRAVPGVDVEARGRRQLDAGRGRLRRAGHRPERHASLPSFRKATPRALLRSQSAFVASASQPAPPRICWSVEYAFPCPSSPLDPVT